MGIRAAGTRVLRNARSRATTGICHAATLGALCTLAAAFAVPAAAAAATTQTFTYTGSEQTFTVPASVTSLELLAAGGHGGSAARAGGIAAQVTGTVSVTPGETLYVEVGGNGQSGSPSGNGVAVSGGFNGGAPGGAGGGGDSDVRTSPAGGGLSPEDRLIVAGGGGGSGQNGSCSGGAGGNAEQSGEGGNCGNGGGGAGTQGGGGAGGTGGCGSGEGGRRGSGGVGGGDGFNGEICNFDVGGGGGGGYYGGGGGNGASSDSSGGGGGGSSLVPVGGSSTLTAPGAEPEVQITYTPSASAPAVETNPASSIKQSSAALNATVDPEGSPVTACTFEYGTSTAYGASVPCSSSPGEGTSPVAVSAAVSGLSASTTYHFRISATNEGGTAVGTDQSFTTAPPTEELPELGRCIKLKKATGKYQGSSCTTKSAGENTGSYEWSFGPGAARAFTFKNGAATLETVGKVQIKCTENTYSGEYSGSKTAIVRLKLGGCEPTNRLGIKCQSFEAGTGEVNFNALEGELGFIHAGAEPAVGMALTPTAINQPYVAQFKCGEVPVAITGGVIASYSPVNKMSASFSVTFKSTKGVQTPEALEGGAPELLSMSIGGASAEQAGLKATDKATNQESLEIKAS